MDAGGGKSVTTAEAEAASHLTRRRETAARVCMEISPRWCGSELQKTGKRAQKEKRSVKQSSIEEKLSVKR